MEIGKCGSPTPPVIAKSPGPLAAIATATAGNNNLLASCLAGLNGVVETLGGRIPGEIANTDENPIDEGALPAIQENCNIQTEQINHLNTLIEECRRLLT